MAESWSGRTNRIYGSKLHQDGLSTSSPSSYEIQNVRLRTITSRSCNNTPGYYDKVEKGLILPNNYFLYQKDVDLYPFGEERYWNNITGKQSAIYSGTFVYDSEDVIFKPLISQAYKDRIKEKAKTKLLKSIQDAKGNQAIACAEANKTFKLVSESATKIAKSLLSLKKGNFTQAARDLGVFASRGAIRRARRETVGTTSAVREKALARSWLELQYGWKPLLQSVYEAAQQLADTQAPIIRYIAHGYHWEPLLYSNRRTVTIGGEPTTLYERYDIDYEYSYKCVYIISNSVAHRASMNGLSNPLSVAWELMPWSFVIDWFLPVGDYIDLLDATSGLSFVSGCATSCEDASYSKDFDQRSKYHTKTTSSASQRFRIERSALLGFPSLSYPRPRFPTSMTKAANALALLQQFRK